ncbi:MAG: ATP-dependent RNA helicase DeaD [Sodalis sp.]|nr:MAG: ATP-dependent RNA helicase DeaD [Sodalis sp.]
MNQARREQALDHLDRTGLALLFVENRERCLLCNIERIMKLTISEVELPAAEVLSIRRLAKFSAKV